MSLARGVHAAGSDVIKIGLIGCGGRGSGAAANAMNAGKDVRLVAMADIFDDRMQGSRGRLQKMYPEQAAVDDDHCFVGFDAYEKLIQSGVDVVLIAGASHFHPLHLDGRRRRRQARLLRKAARPGRAGPENGHGRRRRGQEEESLPRLRAVLALRPGRPRDDEAVRDGAIGEIVAIQETYIGTPYVLRERKPEWSEMEYQLQNWYHFNWLSGDQTAQQLVHSLDKASWALGDKPPLKAWGMGGRQVCLEPKYGDQFDHHAVVFEYANGVRVFGFCRDILGCYNETSDVILGTKGRAILPSKPRIEGENPWRYEAAQAEHVRRRTRGTLRRHPRGQDGQQRRLHVHQYDAGDPCPNGLLHGPGDHLGEGHEFEAELLAAALRLGRRAAGEARRQRPAMPRPCRGSRGSVNVV